MRLLLDSHFVIWALAESAQLSAAFRTLISDRRSEIHISAASIWEIGLKYSTKRQSAPPFDAARAIAMCETAGYALVPITPHQTASATTLPPIHADPFDRLLVAQAFDGPYRLVTRDPTVARYSDSIILMR